MPQVRRVLILRFSSFGDVLQSLSVAGSIKHQWPDAEVHFCTREDFSPLMKNHPSIQRIWVLNRGTGFKGLLKLASELKQIPFTHIYDCHNNLRTHILGWCLNGFLGWRKLLKGHVFLRRPIYRWKRFLLFRFRINKFPTPFSGQRALLEPLKKWGLSSELPAVPQLFFDASEEQKTLSGLGLLVNDSIALAPSAAYPLKRWPLEYFKQLIELCPSEKFIVLGGPQDGFAAELESLAPDRVRNLAGKLSLMQSSVVVAHVKALVSNDTGLMHVAEQTGTSCVALMGPAPFGFPSRPATQILQRDLACRPCSKHGQGPCINREKFQQCLVDIKPEEVREKLQPMLNEEAY